MKPTTPEQLEFEMKQMELEQVAVLLQIAKLVLLLERPHGNDSQTREPCECGMCHQVVTLQKLFDA